MKYTFGTIERDGRLELSDASGCLDWLGQSETHCLVRVLSDGCLSIRSLDTWAQETGVSREEAVQIITSAAQQMGPGEVPDTSLANVIRVKRRGRPAIKFKLSPTALWALFPPDYGPIAPERRRCSAKVLLQAGADMLLVWSSEGKGWLRTPDLKP